MEMPHNFMRHVIKAKKKNGRDYKGNKNATCKQVYYLIFVMVFRIKTNKSAKKLYISVDLDAFQEMIFF